MFDSESGSLTRMITVENIAKVDFETWVFQVASGRPGARGTHAMTDESRLGKRLQKPGSPPISYTKSHLSIVLEGSELYFSSRWIHKASKACPSQPGHICTYWFIFVCMCTYHVCVCMYVYV